MKYKRRARLDRHRGQERATRRRCRWRSRRRATSCAAAATCGPAQPDNFGITTSETLAQLYHNLTGGIFVVTIGVAAISLLVGGIVIMNIMLVSVTERTREIGVRKALGARRRDILTQFLVEATTLSLAGGMIGIALGVGLALLVGAVSPLPAAVSMPAVVMGIVMSSLIGIFFGSYPACRAPRGSIRSKRCATSSA